MVVELVGLKLAKTFAVSENVQELLLNRCQLEGLKIGQNLLRLKLTECQLTIDSMMPVA